MCMTSYYMKRQVSRHSSRTQPRFTRAILLNTVERNNQSIVELSFVRGATAFVVKRTFVSVTAFNSWQH